MYMVETPKTAVDIAMQLMDDWHDDIDSDDPPVGYDRVDTHADAAVKVKFESGREFLITINRTDDL